MPISAADVILIRPQEHDYDYLQWHEDVALGHLLRELTDKGVVTEVRDYAVEPLLSIEQAKDAVAEVSKLRPKMICLVIDKHPTNSPHYAGEMIRMLKSSPNLSSAHITIYGNTQVGTERLLREFPVDSVIIGEESEGCELALAVLSNKPLSEVPGIAFLDSEGEYKRSLPIRPHGAFASSHPPKRYLFDIKSGRRPDVQYVAAIEASRGCYAKCTFCYIRTKERVYGDYGWVGRTPDNVFAEMYDLYHAHGVREFAFIDPQFFGPGPSGQRWAQDLARLIIGGGLNDIAFSIYARANDMRRDTLTLLKTAGLYAVFVGIESFSASVLRRYRKGVTVHRNIEAIRLLMDLDIRLRMGFVSFDHFTTFGELEETVAGLESLLDHKPHLITQPVFFQNILAPLDDTPVGDAYREIGASGMATYQPRDRLLLARRQERLMRGGAITRFADERVSMVSELARVLAGEIVQRSTMLEVSCLPYLARRCDSIRFQETLLSPEQVVRWFNKLTAFAINQFANIVRTVRESPSEAPDGGLFADLEQSIEMSMKDYDRSVLGFEIGELQDAHATIID